jgi:hypothetical protein
MGWIHGRDIWEPPSARPISEPDELIDGIVKALGLTAGVASAAVWLPPLAAKGIAIISAHKTALAVSTLVAATESLMKGETPKETASKIVKAACLSVAVKDPLESWLNELRDHIK